MRRTLAVLIVSLVAPLWATSLHGAAENDASEKLFTVRDSIAISYIVDVTPSTNIGTSASQPLGSPIYSPDHKYFALVTQRGRFATNDLESTIWLFDLKAIENYVLKKTFAKPNPRKLITLAATSNSPVVDDVRWIDGSNKIAFLGKNHSPYRRLFVADVKAGSVASITPDHQYVTAYDMRGGTVVYSVLTEQKRSTGFDSPLIRVDRQSLFELLYPSPPSIEDIGESLLSRMPSSLHLERNGKEIPTRFTMNGKPLSLYVPTLSLSKDAESLITVAPVDVVPKGWESYEPENEQFRLVPGPVQPKALQTFGSFWRPEEYVVASLQTGKVSPLVEAPAGRDMGYSAPTAAFWFDDDRFALLTNTYLPIINDDGSEGEREKRPVVAVFDARTRSIRKLADLHPSGQDESKHFAEITRVEWDRATRQLTLRYRSAAKDEVLSPMRYVLRAKQWLSLSSADDDLTDRESGKIFLSVREDLNHAPELWASPRQQRTDQLVWDPNPQLSMVKLGSASVCRWVDGNGQSWAGILVLPPDFDQARRYPLVIQTHGYDASRFFADGEYTTGNGGRALAAHGIVVLQMSMSLTHLSTPQEYEDNLAGFESAVAHLTAEGIVDRNRVGIVGFSRTAAHVLYALERRPNLFAAAMVTSPDFSYVPYLVYSTGAAEESEKEAEELNGGIPYGNQLYKWLDNAPNFNLAKIRSPLLMTAFEQGTLIAEWETFAGLRRLNKPVDLLWFWREDAPHVLVEPAQRYASQQTAVDWFNFWLNGSEDPDLTRPDLYRRWRELREINAPDESPADRR